MAVDDARAIEVVRRQLAAHTVARQDADAEAAHLAGDMAEDDMVVVESHAEHRVREGLDHLALELDFFFLWHAGNRTSDQRIGAYQRVGAPAPPPWLGPGVWLLGGAGLVGAGCGGCA